MWNESKCQRSNTLHIGVNVCTVKRCNRLQERTFGLEENSLFSLEVARPINEIFKTTPTLANCLNFLKHLRRQHEINFGVNELTARWLTRRVCMGALNRYLRIIFTTRREKKNDSWTKFVINFEIIGSSIEASFFPHCATKFWFPLSWTNERMWLTKYWVFPVYFRFISFNLIKRHIAWLSYMDHYQWKSNLRLNLSSASHLCKY